MSDLIDRYAAIDAIRKLSQDNGYIDMPHEYVTDAIRRLPSARLKHDDITTSEQPKSDRLGVKTGETCTDTISRQAAIRIASGYCHPTNIAKELAKLPSAQPEQDMVDDLISFIEREKGKENRTLADWTVQWILESIIDGECKITGSATDHEEKKMYVEFSFYQEEHDG